MHVVFTSKAPLTVTQSSLYFESSIVHPSDGDSYPEINELSSIVALVEVP